MLKYFMKNNKMEIINNNIDISNPSFLKEFCTEKAIPKEFLSAENINELEEEFRAFSLAAYLYKKHTKKKYNSENLKIISEIKKVGIYQYLQATLQKNIESIISDTFYLNELLKLAKSDIEDFNKKLDNGSTIDAYSTVGLIRDINQDSLKIFHLGKLTILMVADGVGGGEDGEVASKIACETVLKNLKNQDFEIKTDNEIKIILKKNILKANDAVISYADKNKIDTIGTTLSVAIIYNQKLFIGHIGDSRIYRIKVNEEPKLITQDHSLPEVLFRLGKINKEEKENYKKNILVYVIGKRDLKEEDIYISQEVNLNQSDELFLCSDGVWDCISQDRFRDNIKELKYHLLNSIPNDNATFIRFKL